MEKETDLHTAAARIEALRAGSGASPIGEGIRRLMEHVDDAEAGQPEAYVFSDLQKYTWLRGGDTGKMPVPLAAELVGKLSAKCEMFLVDVGGEPKFNYMLTELGPEEWLLSTGMPVRFRARVEAWGKPPPEATATVTFLVDGVKKGVREARPESTGKMPVPPAPLVFEHRFARPGEYLIEAVVEGDEHRVDNRRMCLVTVPENVEVLVLDESASSPNLPQVPEPAGGSALPPSAYLVRAIAPPSHPGMERVSRFAAKVIHPSQADYENVERYGAVVLCDTGSLTEALAAKLEGYVSDGGALWLFLGPRVNVYQYNKLLLREGKGLLPCRLAGQTAEGQDEHALRFGQSTHPALAVLTGSGGSDASFLHHMDIELQAGARVVLALSNGAPALVEKGFGRGKVLLANTTAGVEWTRLPATAEFPILVQELLRYLVGSPDAGVNLSVGDRFESPVFVSTQHLMLRHPDGRRERVTPRLGTHSGRNVSPDRKDAWLMTFAGTQQQGLYEIVDAPPEALPRLRFVVNQMPQEGDLSRLSAGEVRDALGGAWRPIGPEVPLEEFAARLHAVTELAPEVLWLLAAVLAAESFLAVRFGRRRRGAAA